MILRSLSPSATSPGTEIEPVWNAIERSQHQDFSRGCWLIPQPSHAALAGDIAARLNPTFFPDITPEVVHAIALHDSGWSLDDAHVIQESRAKGGKAKPYSFITALPQDTAAAWSGSINIAGKSSPLGGYLVSRHFGAIGEMYRQQVDKETAAVLTDFLAQEATRQQKLRRKIDLADSELGRLVEALQFCDLLSLYLACGVEGDVEFPQQVAGEPIRLRREDATLVRLAPYPFAGDASFSIAGLRHPRMELSSQTFTLDVKPL